MKNKNIFILLLTSFMISCSSSNISFNFETDFSNGYNKNLWYKNDLEIKCADPSVIYSEEDGYYYMYMTTDELSCTGFNVYRSKQLNYWEKLYPCFVPDANTWGSTKLWAPNVIKIGNLYYLYYSGLNRVTKRKGISVAVSETAAGPFHEYEGLDANGKIITRNDQVFDFGFSVIDADPFIDDDGQMYLYFSRDQDNKTSNVMGVKLIDPVTPDLSTLTMLTEPGQTTVDSETIDINWEIYSGSGKWNEAPFMFKKDGQYYLTYSANIYTSVAYGVGYALGDSPLGEFVKPNSYENENLILGVEPEEQTTNWDFMSGSGHHCFFYAGDELMIAYHAHIDRLIGNSTRAFAIDRAFVKNKKIFVNGPTFSLQPLPASVGGYRNIAKEATLDLDEINNKILLTDDIIPMHQFRQEHVDLQAKFKKGTHTLVFSFDKPIKATAVAIYNSLSFDTKIDKVENVIIDGFDYATNIPFNKEYLDNYYEQYSSNYLRPGCPYIVEFNEHETNKISITLSANHDFAVSEIVILGR